MSQIQGAADARTPKPQPVCSKQHGVSVSGSRVSKGESGEGGGQRCDVRKGRGLGFDSWVGEIGALEGFMQKSNMPVPRFQESVWLLPWDGPEHRAGGQVGSWETRCR